MKRILLFVIIICQLSILNYSFAQNPLVKKWDARFGGTDDDYLHSTIEQTTDGGYILGGYSYSGNNGDKTQVNWGGADYWIVKTDSLGITQWNKRFGGINDDYLYSLQQTTDGGYILGGWSYSGTGGDKTQANRDATGNTPDYWIVKIDSLGNKQWDKSFGGTAFDELYSLQQTSDGGYILGGWSHSDAGGDKTQAGWDPTGNTADYWIVKTDSLGNKQWDKRFGGINDDELYSLHQCFDGGYILGGYSKSGISGDKSQNSPDTSGNPIYKGDYWIVKTDSLGNKQWDKRFGGILEDRLYSIQQTTDTGFILGGWSYSGSGGDKTPVNWDPSCKTSDFWIIKTDSLGNPQWDKDFGGTKSEDDFRNISQTSDGGYLIAGTSYSQTSGDKTENNLGPEQSWIIKTDSLGAKQWDKTIFTLGHDEAGYAIQTKDGCFAVANYTNGGIGGDKTQPSRGFLDYWIIKLCDSTLLALPVANFASSDTAFCDEGGKCLDFFDHSAGKPTSWQWSFPGAIPATSTQQNPTNICFTTPGTYAVTLIVTNANGSDTLVISPMITFGQTPPAPTLIVIGDTITCSHASSYQWFFNGSPIAGATDSSYVATQAGSYNVQITDSIGCSRLGNGVLASVNEVGISSQGFSIYPNPVKDNLIIRQFDNLIINYQISIYNILGEKLYPAQPEILNGKLETVIDVSGFARGVYVIQITCPDVIGSSDRVYRSRFVKE